MTGVMCVEITDGNSPERGPVVAEFLQAFNGAPISAGTLTELRAWFGRLRMEVESDRRPYTKDESEAVEMCRTLEDFLLNQMGFFGEGRL